MKKRVVFHCCLIFSKEKIFQGSHLCYTFLISQPCRDPVKVHRVFPSSHRKSASARTFQFHGVDARDSREVVTPFMHVGTYPTRNFATLGPLQLQPPFTRVQIQCKNTPSYLTGTGQASDPIHHLSNSQSPVFLVNSRPPLFSAPNQLSIQLLNTNQRLHLGHQFYPQKPVNRQCTLSFFFPKLQKQFAEFLQNHSAIRLSVLHQPTSVGFSTVLNSWLFPATIIIILL